MAGIAFVREEVLETVVCERAGRVGAPFSAAVPIAASREGEAGALAPQAASARHAPNGSQRWLSLERMKPERFAIYVFAT